jgi:heptosyltransferase II
MQSVALFLPNWIGDVVMATPAIRAARQRYPKAKLLAVCRPYVAETLAGSPWFDEVLATPRFSPFDQGFWKLVQQLRQEKLDASVLFPNSFRVALLARLAGSKQIVGYARYLRDALLTKRFYPVRGRSGQPEPRPIINDYNRLVMALDVPDPGHRMELFTTPKDDSAALAIWTKHNLSRFAKVIGLNPGGAFGAAKHWPTEHFAQLARDLASKHQAGVIVLCGPAERDIAKRITEQTNSPSVVSLHDEALSLGLTKAIVKKLSMLVTTDSGPRHFAPAFGVPVVSLFGPTFIEWTNTFYADEIHLQKKLPCGPCQQRVCPLGHHQCMTDLKPAEVLQSVESLLAKVRPRGVLHYAG